MRALDDLTALGGTFLVPGDPGWPGRLHDLGPLAPLCLWVRGTADLDALSDRSVAIVGARAATPYGERVSADLAAGVAASGVTVVSGGAYGIDVAAHRGALAAGGPTIALLAGGIDRPYPAGNRDVLEALVERGGALVAESPPGTPPVRSRFLLRNRLIAAMSEATVVVEAAWRSGALSTAARATALLRPLGAVPGPVTSVASAGCHRLLRDGYAVCVTDAAEVLELVGPAVAGPTDDPSVVPPPGRSAGDGRGRASDRDQAGVRQRAGATEQGGGREQSDDRERPGGGGEQSGGRDQPGGVGDESDDREQRGGGREQRGGGREEVGGREQAGGGEPLGPRDGTGRTPDRGAGHGDGLALRDRGRDGGAIDRWGVGGRAVGRGAGADERADSSTARVLDALPVRGSMTVDRIARDAGMSWTDVESALGVLELRGRAARHGGRWRRLAP